MSRLHQFCMKSLKEYANRRKSSRDSENSNAARKSKNGVAISREVQPLSSRHDTVIAAFFAYANDLRSSRIAVRDYANDEKRRETTYQELASRVQRLSSCLAANDVKKGSKIPLLATPGLESVIGILAILSRGAGFIPVDHELQSDDYIREAVKWSGQNVVLSVSRATDIRLRAIFATRLLSLEAPVSVVSIHGEAIAPTSDRFEPQATADDVCYVVFTTGWPGSSREVHVTHRSLVNLVCLWPGNLGIQRRPGALVGQTLGVGCDIAAWEIFACLCNGGTLVIGGDKPERALREVEVLITTPTALSNYRPWQLPNVKVVAAFGCECISYHLADQWDGHVEEFWICYGSSETTLATTMSLHQRFRCAAGEPCKQDQLSLGCPTLTGRDTVAFLGIPIPNVVVYVLNEKGELRQCGQPGPLWVGGRGTSNLYVGYTAESRMRNPFTKDGSYIYRTGGYGTCTKSGIELVPPMSAGEYLTSGRDLSQVELARVRSAMHCVAGTSSVAAVSIGKRIYGFVVPEALSGNFPRAVGMSLAGRIEKHEKVLRNRGGITQDAYIHESLYVDAIPVDHDGMLDRDALLLLIRRVE